jgi:hypothetical protein
MIVENKQTFRQDKMNKSIVIILAMLKSQSDLARVTANELPYQQERALQLRESTPW